MNCLPTTVFWSIPKPNTAIYHHVVVLGFCNLQHFNAVFLKRRRGFGEQIQDAGRRQRLERRSRGIIMRLDESYSKNCTRCLNVCCKAKVMIWRLRSFAPSRFCISFQTGSGCIVLKSNIIVLLVLVSSRETCDPLCLLYNYIQTYFLTTRVLPFI